MEGRVALVTGGARGDRRSLRPSPRRGGRARGRRRGGGSIVNMAPVLGSVAFPSSAAEHAAIGLTRAAALGHAADGIRVNAVAPAFIDVPGKERGDGIVAAHPLGRIGTADEVAEVVAWLAPNALSVPCDFAAAGRGRHGVRGRR